MDRITKDAAPFTRSDEPDEKEPAPSRSTNPPALSGHQTTESLANDVEDNDDETSRLKLEKAKNSSLEASPPIEEEISKLKLENSKSDRENRARVGGEGRGRQSKTGNEVGGANAIVVEPDDDQAQGARALVEPPRQRSSEERNASSSSSSSTRHQSSRPQVNQTNINIDKLNTLVLGNMNQMIAQNGGGEHNREVDTEEDRRQRLLDKYSDAELKTLKKRSRCKKLVTDSNVRIVASKLGKEWESVGHQLHFNHTQLDDVVSAVGGPTSSNFDRAELMLLRWLEWSDHRATVARLVKALHLNDRHDIILALEIDDEELEESGQSSS